MDISNNELVRKLLELRGNERKITVEILRCLIELENRKLYAEEGYSSMFDYCVRKLGYSESSAYRRISAARILRDRPELEDLILEGKLNLCSVATASKNIAANKTELSEIAGKSLREVQKLIAPELPKSKEKITPFVVQKVSLPMIEPEVKEKRYEIKFSVSEDVFRQFEEAKNQLSNTLGERLNLEGVLGKLLNLYLKPKLRKSTPSFDSRYVPKATKHTVREQCHNQCSFIAKDGTRCTEKRYLQFDHIEPFSLGGKSSPENLRLLCPAHNQHIAREVFHFQR